MSGDVILKAINTGADPVSATLNVRGVFAVTPNATITVLNSGSLSDNNSLDQPTKVVPLERRLDNAAAQFRHGFPPYSLTVLRLKTRGAIR